MGFEAPEIVVVDSVGGPGLGPGPGSVGRSLRGRPGVVVVAQLAAGTDPVAAAEPVMVEVVPVPAALDFELLGGPASPRSGRVVASAGGSSEMGLDCLPAAPFGCSLPVAVEARAVAQVPRASFLLASSADGR